MSRRSRHVAAPNLGVTRPQARQRSLAWALYVIRGCAANLAGLLARDCEALAPADRREVEALIDRIRLADAKIVERHHTRIFTDWPTGPGSSR